MPKMSWVKGESERERGVEGGREDKKVRDTG